MPGSFVQTATIGGSSYGDPHMRCYDGDRHDCQGRGEFVLTRAAATDSEVQVRFQPYSRNPSAAVTVATDVAAREGDSSVVQVLLATSGDEVDVLIDGEPYDEVLGPVTGVALEVTPTRVEIRFPSGLDVFISTEYAFLVVNTYVPLDLATTGLLGNNNGEKGDDWTVSAQSSPAAYVSASSGPTPFSAQTYIPRPFCLQHEKEGFEFSRFPFFFCPTKQTADGEIVEFALAGGPTVTEGTTYCTSNWCTTQESSIFTYAEGEDHGTYDLCDAVYSPPVLPDVVPDSVTDVRNLVPVVTGARGGFCTRSLPSVASAGINWCRA